MKEYIPQIYIVHAGIFDKGRRAYFEREGKEYPSVKLMKHELEYIRELWSKANENDRIIREILSLLEVNPGYDFEVYLVGKYQSMSVPIIASRYMDDNTKKSDALMLETIVHELIHRIIHSPRKEKNYSTEKYWKYIEEEYKDFSFTAQRHFLVYALLEKVLPIGFTKEQFREISDSFLSVTKEGYVEAIALVKDKGADFFIKEFTDRVLKLKVS